MKRNTIVAEGIVFYAKRGRREIPLLIPTEWLHEELDHRDMIAAARDPEQSGRVLDPAVIREWDIREADRVTFSEEPFRIVSVFGLTRPEDSRDRPHFDREKMQLKFRYPRVRIPYDTAIDSQTLRTFGLWVPFGRGAQGFFPADWGAGKTVTAQEMIKALFTLAARGDSSLGNPYFVILTTGGIERAMDMGELHDILTKFRGRVPFVHYYGFGAFSNGNSGRIAIQTSRRLFELGYDPILIGDSFNGVIQGLTTLSEDTKLGTGGLPASVVSDVLSDYLFSGMTAEGRSITLLYTALTPKSGLAAAAWEMAGGPGSTTTWSHMNLEGHNVDYPWVDLVKSRARRPGLLLAGDAAREYALVRKLVTAKRLEENHLAALTFLQRLAGIPRGELLERLEELNQKAEEEKRRKASAEAITQVVNVAPILKEHVRDQVGTVLAMLKAAGIDLAEFLAELIKRLDAGVREALLAKLQEKKLLPVPKASEEELEALRGEVAYLKRLASFWTIVAKLSMAGKLPKPVGAPLVKKWAGGPYDLQDVRKQLEEGVDPAYVRPREADAR